jgi:hypothetical protein
MKTDELIEALAGAAQPVGTIATPERRTALWLMLSLPYVAFVVVAMGLRPDLLERLSTSRFLVEQFAALATSIVAAHFALTAVIPGSTRLPIVFVAAPIGIWIGSLLGDTLAAALTSGWGGLALEPDFFCIPGITMVSAFPAVLMIFMLRDGAPLTPRPTVFLGILAATAMGNFGLRLFHPQDSGPMVLFWQVGTVSLICLATTWVSDHLLSWQRRIDKSL